MEGPKGATAFEMRRCQEALNLGDGVGRCGDRRECCGHGKGLRSFWQEPAHQ